MEVTVETYVNPLNVAPIPVVDYVRVADSIKNNNMEAGFVGIGAILIVGGIIFLPETIVGTAVVATAAAFISVITWGKELIS